MLKKSFFGDIASAPRPVGINSGKDDLNKIELNAQTDFSDYEELTDEDEVDIAGTLEKESEKMIEELDPDSVDWDKAEEEEPLDLNKNPASSSLEEEEEEIEEEYGEGGLFEGADPNFIADQIFDAILKGRNWGYETLYKKFVDPKDLRKKMSALIQKENRTEEENAELRILDKMMNKYDEIHTQFTAHIPFKPKHEQFLRNAFRHYFVKFKRKKGVSDKQLFIGSIVLHECMIGFALFSAVQSSKNIR